MGRLRGGLSVQDEFADYMREIKERSEQTIYSYLRRWAFVERQVSKPIEQVTPDDLFALKRVLRQAGYSSSQIKSSFVVVRQVHLWGAATGRWKRNGIMEVPVPKETNHSSSPLSIEKVQMILAVAEGPTEFKVSFVPAYGGLRVGETASLTEWNDGWLEFIGKGNKRRRVPAHPCLEAKRDVMFDRPTYSLGAMKEAKERIVDKVGFHYVTHQLRKSFSTELHNAGVSDLCRKELLGHSTGLDSVYTLVSDREKQEAVAVLPY